jgi:hypothetical protein
VAMAASVPRAEEGEGRVTKAALHD